VDTGSDDKRAVSALQRAFVGVLSALRRLLGTINQVVFRDRLRDIDRQTERLGSASVEAVTHLGGEVRALDQRLAAIERELAELRKLLERGERTSTEDDEQVAARPHAG
jgi:predicted  nucleic acid-binding Zn-ribbon protein